MKKSNIFPIVAVSTGLAALFFWLKRKASAGENIKIDPVDIKIDTAATKQSGFLRLYYTVKIKLINNESESVVVNNVSLQVSSNGSPLGEITKSDSFQVPALSEKIVSFNASIPTIGILSLIRNVIINGLNIPIQVSGFINTDLGRVNVNFTKTIGSGISGRRAVN